MSGTRLARLELRPIPIDRTEVRCFAVVRNEALRLPYFLDYHRGLGVDRFFIVDNASQDNSPDLLLAQDDVHVFHTDESYASSGCGIAWLNKLLDRYGAEHWALTLDADELLVYPLCERIRIQQLIGYLEHVHEEGLVTFLLDMYSRHSIRDTQYQPGVPFQSVCTYFDRDTYHETDAKGIPIRGGPRHRLFWEGRDRPKPSPVLKKIPLVKWRQGLSYEASTHAISNVRVGSALTGVLMHFKLFADFYSYAKKETERKEHWDSAAQYSSYWNVLNENPALSAYFEGSVAYEDSAQLVELGLMHMPSDLLQFLEITGNSTNDVG